MRITKISLGILSLPLVTPFQTALRRVEAIEDLVVRIEAENGTAGYGEAPPTAVITGETLPSIREAVATYLAPAILGQDLSAPEEIFARLDKAMAKNTSAKAALDIALYDLMGRLQGKPLWELLSVPGEEPKKELDTDLTISLGDVPQMVRDSLLAREQGFSILKVKVGRGGAADVERVRAIREAVGKDVVLRIDANQGWTPREAIETISAMEDALLSIELVEQPVSCHDYDGLRLVTGSTKTPILADESVFSFEDARRIVEDHAADMINIKLMKTGGIHEALRICDLAARNQISCMAGCMLESAVSVSAAVHLAAARSCITMCDLDGPALCAVNPFTGGPLYQGAKICPGTLPGIGLEGLPVQWQEVASL